MKMTRDEFQRKLENIGATYRRDMASVKAPANATPAQFTQAQMLRDSIERKYIDDSLALQREMGIATPVAMGVSE